MRMRRRWRRSASAQSMSSASRRALPCRRSSAAAANAPSEPSAFSALAFQGSSLTQRRARRRKACSLGDAAALRARRRAAARFARARASSGARSGARSGSCVPKCTRVSLNTSQSRAAPRSGIRARSRSAGLHRLFRHEIAEGEQRGAQPPQADPHLVQIFGVAAIRHAARVRSRLGQRRAEDRTECLARGGDLAELRTAPLARRRKSLARHQAVAALGFARTRAQARAPWQGGRHSAAAKPRCRP